MGKMASSQNITNELQASQLASLHDEIKHLDFRMIDRIEQNDPLNNKFSKQEFFSVLRQGRSASTPGTP